MIKCTLNYDIAHSAMKKVKNRCACSDFEENIHRSVSQKKKFQPASNQPLGFVHKVSGKSDEATRRGAQDRRPGNVVVDKD